MPKILNLRNLGHTLPKSARRVDRQTMWGNPYPITETVTRNEVVIKYRRYLIRQIKKGAITKGDLMTLHGRDLACWCAPERCHAEILMEFANAAADGTLDELLK